MLIERCGIRLRRCQVRRSRSWTARVVDPDADRARTINFRLNRHRQGWQITGIDADIAVLLSFGSGKLLHYLGELVLAARHDQHLRALQGELPRTGGTEALTATADQGAFPGKIQIHRSLQSS